MVTFNTGAIPIGFKYHRLDYDIIEPNMKEEMK